MVQVTAQHNRHLAHSLHMTRPFPPLPQLAATGHGTAMNYGELADIAVDWHCLVGPDIPCLLSIVAPQPIACQYQSILSTTHIMFNLY